MFGTCSTQCQELQYLAPKSTSTDHEQLLVLDFFLVFSTKNHSLTIVSVIFVICIFLSNSVNQLKAVVEPVLHYWSVLSSYCFQCLLSTPGTDYRAHWRKLTHVLSDEFPRQLLCQVGL